MVPKTIQFNLCTITIFKDGGIGIGDTHTETYTSINKEEAEELVNEYKKIEVSNLDNPKIYTIHCRRFKIILIANPTPEEIHTIKQLRDKLSFDNYAEYSPEENKLYEELKTFVKSTKKFIPYNIL